MVDLSPRSLSHTSVGQQLGDYHLIRLIGKGASASIYLAEHRYLEQLVAVKIFQPRRENIHLQVFASEAQITSRLAHPHIVPIIDFGRIGAIPFLVMEYAPYGTLRTQHKTGYVLPPGLICQYVKQIASALQHVHDNGFIHQDVKPENVLLGQKRQLLLSDFGISIPIRKAQEQNKTQPIGTLLYMAPEQIKGRPCPASDQYALAVVVYEWLCGIWPFQGTSYAIARQHLYTELTSICSLAPAIPSTIEQVVLKALAKDPAQRFASVQEFALALEQAYRDAPFTRRSTVRPQLYRPLQLTEPNDTISPERASHFPFCTVL